MNITTERTNQSCWLNRSNRIEWPDSCNAFFSPDIIPQERGGMMTCHHVNPRQVTTGINPVNQCEKFTQMTHQSYHRHPRENAWILRSTQIILHPTESSSLPHHTKEQIDKIERYNAQCFITSVSSTTKMNEDQGISYLNITQHLPCHSHYC